MIFMHYKEYHLEKDFLMRTDIQHMVCHQNIITRDYMPKLNQTCIWS